MTDRLDRITALRSAASGGLFDWTACWVAFPQDFVEEGGSAWAFRVGDAFTGSLDAARALHEALLPGWVWWFEPFREIAFCGVYNPAVSPMPITAGDTNPARAWLLAILGALIAQEGGE